MSHDLTLEPMRQVPHYSWLIRFLEQWNEALIAKHSFRLGATPIDLPAN